jgi:hypothetical protein
MMASLRETQKQTGRPCDTKPNRSPERNVYNSSSDGFSNKCRNALR